MNYTLKEVFGVRAEPVLSYVERPNVDNRFTSGLATDKQIIVYGASKQGKTSLVEKHLPYEDNIVIRVTPKTDVDDIYKSILRQQGVRIISESTTVSSRESSVSIGTKAKAQIPFFGSGEATAKGDIKAGNDSEVKYEEVDFNLSIPQDIAELLQRTGLRKTIILENFHYLRDEIQRQLAFDIRTFQELHIRFVILGVWREKNRLSQFNGDLLDRIIEVPVEPWDVNDFARVASEGGRHLKIAFADYMLKEAIDNSFSSIGVFQEILRETCSNAGIHQSQEILVTIENQLHLKNAIIRKAYDYASRHQRVLEDMAIGNTTVGNREGLQSLCLPYYLVKIILSNGFDGLSNGMSRSKIHSEIQFIHHRPMDVRHSDMSNLLHTLATMQSNKGIIPPIFDYDRGSRRLQVIDSTFYFFLKNADLTQISEDIVNPLAL